MLTQDALSGRGSGAAVRGEWCVGSEKDSEEVGSGRRITGLQSGLRLIFLSDVRSSQLAISAQASNQQVQAVVPLGHATFGGLYHPKIARPRIAHLSPSRAKQITHGGMAAYTSPCLAPRSQVCPFSITARPRAGIQHASTLRPHACPILCSYVQTISFCRATPDPRSVLLPSVYTGGSPEVGFLGGTT